MLYVTQSYSFGWLHYLTHVASHNALRVTFVFSVRFPPVSRLKHLAESCVNNRNSKALAEMELPVVQMVCVENDLYSIFEIYNGK